MSVIEEIDRLISASEKPPTFQTIQGATSEQLNAAESVLQFKLPSALIEWLRFCNGTALGPGGIFGVFCNPEVIDIIEHWKRISFWRTAKMIPLAGDGFGNYYAVPLQGDFGIPEPILFIQMSTRDDLGSRIVVASTALHLVKFLLLKELGESRWPFDREFVTSLDASIESTTGVCLPWSP
jgi:cell wall assembly regulator SMI1